MNNLNKIIKKLQLGIKMNHGVVLTMGRSEWYSTKMDMIINDYTIKRLVKDEETGRSNYVEIFKSTSKIQQVLFLRDYLYWLDGKEIPTDNLMWNEKRRKYYDNEMYKEIRERELMENEAGKKTEE